MDFTDTTDGPGKATQAVLELFADELGLAHTVARGAVLGGGVENEFDAEKAIEQAARDLLEDGGNTATAIRSAVGDPDATVAAVITKVDWAVLGRFFFERYEG